MIISRTPLRMSFVGGGSDLRAYYRDGAGAVISTAIDKYVYITVNKKFDKHIRIGYSQIEYVSDVGQIRHNLVREALTLTGITHSIDVVYMSDMLPAHEGSGLGASSSLLVGTLHALHAYKGEYVSARQLAEEACAIEIDILGHPIGKQDQYIAAYGGMNRIRFNPDESVFVDPLIVEPDTRKRLQERLLLFYTGINARSDTILNEQRQKTPENRSVIDRMVAMTETGKALIEKGDCAAFGELLHEGWFLKQRLASRITNDAIDDIYERARAAGARGGKILGSGGGGFLLVYSEPEQQQAVRTALSDLREVSIRFEGQGSKIIYVSD